MLYTMQYSHHTLAGPPARPPCSTPLRQWHQDITSTVEDTQIMRPSSQTSNQLTPALPKSRYELLVGIYIYISREPAKFETSDWNGPLIRRRCNRYSWDPPTPCVQLLAAIHWLTSYAWQAIDSLCMAPWLTGHLYDGNTHHRARIVASPSYLASPPLALFPSSPAHAPVP